RPGHAADRRRQPGRRARVGGGRPVERAGRGRRAARRGGRHPHPRGRRGLAPPPRRAPRGGRHAMTAPVRVVLVEDQALVRAGFRALIDGADDLVVVGEAASGVEGIAVVAEQRPDVALVDIQLPGMDGVAAMRVMLRQARHPLRVVALTAFDDEDTVMAALRAGASGFLLKDLTPDALLDAVRTVARGDALIAPQVTRMLIER